MSKLSLLDKLLTLYKSIKQFILQFGYFFIGVLKKTQLQALLTQLLPWHESNASC